MAEIKIEKKSKPVWPWLLGLLLLVLLAWGAFEVFQDDRQEVAVTENRDFTEPQADEQQQPEQQTGTDGTAGLTAGPVQEYVEFTNQTEDAEMGVDHEFTSEGLNKLAEALEDVADNAGIEDEQLQANIEDIKSKADFIQEDWEDLTHADSIRAAFASANDAFETIQQQEFPQQSQQVDELKQQAQEVKPGAMTLEQRQEVKEYFDKSAETLETFARATEQ